MKRAVVFAILLLGLWGSGGVFARNIAPEGMDIPGFDSIVGNPAAYRKVLDKFSAGIERPTITECMIAYYGFALQKEFGSGTGGATQTEHLMQQAVMQGDFATAYTLGNRILKTSPVDLTALYWTLHAATQLKEPWEVRNSLKGRYNNIAYVISRSGNGISAEGAFKVISKGDMYTYTTMELGLEIGEGFLWDSRWTEFEVTPSQRFKHSSIFFEIWNGKIWNEKR